MAMTRRLLYALALSAALAGTLAPFGIDVRQALERFSRERDWDENAAVLTDPD